VVVIGGCALCCVVVVIGRQICYNHAHKKSSVHSPEKYMVPGDAADREPIYEEEPTPQPQMQNLAAIKHSSGRYSMNSDQFSGRRDSNRHVGSARSKHRDRGGRKSRSAVMDPSGDAVAHSLSNRDRVDMMDGQAMTVPLKTKRQQTTQFSSNLSNIASGNKLMMNDIVEEMDVEHYTAKAYVEEHSQSHSEHMHQNNHMMGIADQEDDDDEDDDDDDVVIPGKVNVFSKKKKKKKEKKNKKAKRKKSGKNKKQELRENSETEQDRAEYQGGRDYSESRPELHDYVTSALQKLAPTSILSEDDQKLAQPPRNERNAHDNIINIAPYSASTATATATATSTPGTMAATRGTGGSGPYFSSSQYGKLQRAINNAKTNSDFEKLENMIKSGQIPSENWNAKQSRSQQSQFTQQSSATGGGFRGMVTRAFDPNTRLTSCASNATVDTHVSESELYKHVEDVFDENLEYNFSSDFKLPNMTGTESQTSVRTAMTENSIGVKMPQYRAAGTKPMVMMMSENSKSKPKNKSSSIHNKNHITPPKQKSKQLDQRELMSKLFVMQKEDQKRASLAAPPGVASAYAATGHAMVGARGREMKYNRGSSANTSGGGASYEFEHGNISEMEHEFHD